MHVSGHAPAGELLYLLNLVKPSNLHAGARRVAAPAGARPARRSSPGVPPERVVLCEDGDVVDLVDGQARHGRPRARAATCTWTAWPSATSASRCSPSGGSSATAASSRPPWWSTRSPARWSAAPRVSAKGFSDDPDGVRRGAAADHRGAGPGRCGGHHRPAPAPADRAPHGRPLGQRHLPPPADDRPERGRGLTRAIAVRSRPAPAGRLF